MCEGIINTGDPIYIADASNTQYSLEQAVFDQYTYLFSAASSATGCDKMILSSLCARTFYSCAYDENDTPIPVPPCQQFCSDLMSHCPLLASIMTSEPNSQFEHENVSRVSDAVIPPNACDTQRDDICDPRYEYANIGNVSIPVITCPQPLVPAVEGYESVLDGPCAIPCPNLSYTTEDYQREDVVIIVMNVLSLISMIFIFISWTLFPSLQIKSYVYYYFFCILLVTISLFVLIPVAGNDTIASSLCKNSVQEYHMEGYSLFQGLVVSYFYTAGIAWSLVMSVDVFLNAVLEFNWKKRTRQHKIKEIVYHCFAWGVGFYSIIGGLASRQIGATLGVGGAYSLITPSRKQQAEGKFDAGDPFFYYPLLIFTCLSALLMIITLIKVAKYRFAAAKMSGLRRGTFIRLFLFILTNTFIICVFMIYKIYVVDNRQKIEDSAFTFAWCKLLIEGHYGSVQCGSAPEFVPPFGVLLLTVALINGMGVITFMIYGTTAQLYRSYLGCFATRLGWSVFKKYSVYYQSNKRSTGSGPDSHTSKSGPTSQTTHQGSHTGAEDVASSTHHSHAPSNGTAAQSHQGKSVFAYRNQKIQTQDRPLRRPTHHIELTSTSINNSHEATTPQASTSAAAANTPGPKFHPPPPILPPNSLSGPQTPYAPASGTALEMTDLGHDNHPQSPEPRTPAMYKDDLATPSMYVEEDEQQEDE